MNNNNMLIMHVCMVIPYYIKRKDQPDKATNPARGQLNREMNISLSPFAPENFLSRDGFGSPVPPRLPAHLHTQAESGAYLRNFSRFPRRRPFIYSSRHIYAIGSVPSSSVHVNAYRWRSLPTVRRHRASVPQRSSSNRCCLCITMDELICASLSHTHNNYYWYEVGILKLSAYMWVRLSHSVVA